MFIRGGGCKIHTESAAYTITYSTEYGIAPESKTYSEGTILSSDDLPELSEKGYTFNGWYDDDTKAIAGEYKVTKDVTFIAKWSASTNTSYTVKHFLQNVALSDYELDTTENLTGTTGTTTSASAKTYPGFTAQEITQSTIKADGTTEVSIYYDRNTITLIFDTDGGSSVDSISGKYGTSVTAPENPTKTDYIFSNWSPALPITFPAENTTYTAQWKVSLSITASAPTYTSDDENLLTVVSDSSNITFTAQSGYSSYSWYVDGELQQNETKTTFTMNISDYSKGYYTVMLIADNHSATVQVTVRK